jgi:hypothetical protein
MMDTQFIIHVIKEINQNNLKHEKFFFRFKIDKMIQEYGHKVLVYHHIIATSSPFNKSSSRQRYYNSNINLNGFGIEAVTNMWEESLQQVCFLCSLVTRQRLEVLHKIPSLTIF